MCKFCPLPQQDILMMNIKLETFLAFYLFKCSKELISIGNCVHTHTVYMCTDANQNNFQACYTLKNRYISD